MSLKPEDVAWFKIPLDSKCCLFRSACLHREQEGLGYLSMVYGNSHLESEQTILRVGSMAFSGIHLGMRDCSPEVYNTARCGTVWPIVLVQLESLKDKVPAKLTGLR